MTTEGDGARGSQMLMSLVEISVVVVFLVGVATGAWALATGQSYTVTIGDEDVVANYTTTQGEPIVDDVWMDGKDTHVRLSNPPSEHGVSKAYFYARNDTIKKDIEPRQTEIEFGFITFASEQSEIVFYDGNNRVVSAVSVNYTTQPSQVTIP